MSKVLKRKFGVKRINMVMEQGNLICSECGHKAGLHYGSECPKIKPNERLARWANSKLSLEDFELKEKKVIQEMNI